MKTLGLTNVEEKKQRNNQNEQTERNSNKMPDVWRNNKL